MNKKRGKAHTEWASKIKALHPFCVFCNTRENLQAHHVMKYENFKASRADLKNGITVCFDCHTKIHAQAGSYGNRLLGRRNK